jgi:hypothetical protein
MEQHPRILHYIKNACSTNKMHGLQGKLKCTGELIQLFKQASRTWSFMGSADWASTPKPQA